MGVILGSKLIEEIFLNCDKLGVVSKAAKLLTPVQAIADSLRKLLQE